MGPFNIKFSLPWNEFLQAIALNLGVPAMNLKVNTFNWKPLKPKNAAPIPVINDDGFASMTRKLQQKADPSIFLIMDSPLLPTIVCSPSISSHTNYILYTQATTAGEPGIEEEDSLEDEARERGRKKASGVSLYLFILYFLLIFKCL